MKTIKLNVSGTNSSIIYNSANELTNNTDNVTYRIQVVEDNAEIGSINVSVNLNLYDPNTDYSEAINNLMDKIKIAFDNFNKELTN